MDLLKIFPSIVLDLISKIVPGAIVVLVFKNRYIPPNELLLEFLDSPPSPEWVSWGKIAIGVVTAYIIGVFVALLANALDRILIKRWWQRLLANSIDGFIYPEDRPVGLAAAAASPAALVLFVDHCRSAIETRYSSYAAVLERYRTAYRLFCGVTLILIAIPCIKQSLLAAASIPGILVVGALSIYMSKRYLYKSLQLFAIATTAKAESPADHGDSRKAA